MDVSKQPDEVAKPCTQYPMFPCDSQGNNHFCPKCAMMFAIVFTIAFLVIKHRETLMAKLRNTL